MRTVLGLSAAVALAGCVHHPVPRGGETISYATTPCHGTCPVYTVTLGPDGQGIFVGEQFTAVIGERRFQASAAQVAAFADTLARVRPARDREFGKGKGDCEQVATDMSGVRVRWQGALGSTSLSFYYGCRGAEASRVAGDLRAAPDALPIADLIGKR
jgi:hypothetical protein